MGASAELTIEISGTVQQLMIRGRSPGTRVQFVDGVRPIGVAAIDRLGEARLSMASHTSGPHVIRALEWGSGKRIGDVLRFAMPGRPADGLELKEPLDAKAEEIRSLRERLTRIESLLEQSASGANKP